MKKIIFVLFFIIICFKSPLYAETTNEIDIKENFKNFCSIVFPKDTENTIDILNINSGIAIDYSVEILKNKPLSLEAFYTIYFLPKVFNGKTFKDKFNLLKQKHLSNINEINIEIHEKIIFLLMLLSPFVADNEIEKNSNIEIATKVLNNIKNSCEDKNYAALASIILFFDKSEQVNNLKSFKENFPDHPIIPLVELEIQFSNYHDNNVQICIDEIKKLINKYGDISTPFGYKMKNEYLNSLTFCYIKLGDYENASKCVELIKKEAPDYYNLNDLMDVIENHK